MVCESNVIEIEQGKCFDLDIVCQTVDGKAVNGMHFCNEHWEKIVNFLHLLYTYENLDEGRLLQVTAGVKISNKRSEGKFSDEEIITTPLYVLLVCLCIFILVSTSPFF